MRRAGWKPAAAAPKPKPAGVSKKGDRPCTTCNHPLRTAIDKHLILRTMTVQAMAKKYDIGEEALRRHRDAHISEETKRELLLQARVEKQEAVADDLNAERVEIDDGLRKILREIDGILQRAKQNGDDPLALGSLKEMRAALMDLAKLQGTLRNELTVNVSLNEAPQWLQLRAILMEVFERHPAAKADFLARATTLRIADA
jgi:hypothetical protein